MIAEQLIEAGKDPLHNREFIAVQKILMEQAVRFCIQDVKIVECKILDVDLCLRLPPHMHSHQIAVKHMQVKQYMQHNDDQEKQPGPRL